MSFFKKLFGGDPMKLLDKADRALGNEHPAEALDLYRRAHEAADGAGELAAKADKGIRAASDELVGMNRREASLSQEAGDFEGALHHLETAMQLCGNPDLRQALEAEITSVEEQADQADAQPQRLFTTEGAIGEEMLPEEQWDHLLATLDDDVAEDYAERDQDFRDAVLAINDGRSEEAVEVLREQAADDPDDPLVKFELGRALLATEQYADAATELGAAREEVGFLALDRVGLLQIGLIEAEALIGAGEIQAAHRVLTEAIDEVGEEIGLMFLRGRVEGALGDHDGVEQTMGRVMTMSPQAVDAAIVLAESRIARKELDGAVEALEGGLKRYCATGTCHAQPISLPAARLLARTYLDMEQDPGRVEDLLQQVRGSLEGHVPGGAQVLWGRLHKQRGDHDRLAEAREAALAGVPDEPAELRARVEALLG